MRSTIDGYVVIDKDGELWSFHEHKDNAKICQDDIESSEEHNAKKPFKTLKATVIIKEE